MVTNSPPDPTALFPDVEGRPGARLSLIQPQPGENMALEKYGEIARNLSLYPGQNNPE